jgi:uncharacterized protein YegL
MARVTPLGWYTRRMTASTGKLTQDVIFIVDRSGSMANKVADVVGGFNTYVDDLRRTAAADGIQTRFTLVTFATSRRTVLERVPLDEVRAWTEADYRPGGSTALLDTVHGTVSAYAAALGQGEFGQASGDLPSVLCVIVTDGEENASRHATNADVKALLERLEAAGNWTFAYLGANQDAWAESEKFGVSPGSALTIEVGLLRESFDYLSEKTTRVRQYAQRTGKKRTDNLFASSDEDLDKANGEVAPEAVDRVVAQNENT